MTLLQVINTIQKISSVQPNIHSFVGEFLALNDVTAKYSAIILQQRTHRRNNDFMIYSFYLGYSDRLTENKDNEVEVQSTAIQVIDDIVYKLENLNFDCTVGVYNTFTQRFLAEAAGGYVELDIVVPMGECEDDFSKEELDTTITANGEYNFIPKGLGYQSVHLNVDVAHLQDKSLDITKNGNYKVQYDKGYSGLKTVDVNVNVPDAEIHNQKKEELITINNKRYTYTPDKDYTGIGELNVMVQIPEQPIYEEGYVVGKEDGINEQKRKLTDINITQNGTYTKEDGYKSVVVNVPIPEINNQEKSITITENGQTDITPDTNYTGLSRVGVNVNIDTQSYYDNGYSQGKIDGKTEGIAEQKAKLTDINITENGNYSREDGYKSVVVNVPSDKKPETELTKTLNANDTYTYTPDEGTVYNKVIITTDIHPTERLERTYIENGQYLIDGEYKDGVINVNVPVPEINNQEKSITINSNGTSSVVPDTGYTGISKVDITVNVPSSGGGGIDLTSLGYTAQENTSINTDIQDSIAYSQSLLENYTNSTSYSNNNRITFVPLFPCSGRTSFYRMFSYCSSLTTIPALDTTSGTNFSGMFDGCYSLKFVSQLDTSENTDFSYLFSDCKSLTSIPALDTKKGDNFQYMFKNCYMLSSIPYLDTSNTTSTITDFSYMFYGCRSLSTIPEINVTKGYTFEGMFSGCSSLVNIGKLHSILGSEFSNMFSGCYKLETIPLINISDTDDKNNLLQMFQGCSKLKNITFEGSINADISFYYTKILTYNSIKSILTACAATTNTNPKRIEFNQSIQDQNNELTNLVASCTSKGWQVSGLRITTA